MMGIFDPIKKKLPPFKKYLKELFEEKTSYVVGSRDKDAKVLPWEMVLDEIFDPTRIDICESHNFSVSIAEQAETIFRIEFRAKET